MRYNLFRTKKNKKESRSTEVQTPPTITTSEQNQDAIGLIFGKYNGNHLAQNLSAVYRATNLIANSLSSLPIILYKIDSAGNKKQYTTHPVYNLLISKPNKFMTTYDWINSITRDMMLKGNGYSVIHRTGDGKVDHLEYIPASKVSIVKRYNGDNELSEILYNISGKKRLYQDYEICHFKMNPDEDGVEGISILQYARRSIKLAQSNESVAEGMFENGGKVSGVLSVQGAITTKQKENIKQEWRTSMQSNLGGTVVMSGLEKYTPIGSNSQEMELLNSRKFGISEIARFFEVSPILLYDLEKSSYSSAEQAHLSLLTDTLSNYIYKIESELECKLLSPYELERCEIKFDTSEFIRADSKSQSELYRTYYNMGVLSPNDIRQKLDLPSLGEKGDVYLVQGQYVELSHAKNLGSANDPQLDNSIKPVQEQEENKNNDDENNE